ncbi:nucleotide sugar dehydrogenase [Heyndrickxia sporothermodurans]|uniref:nucleotide sugar dehydrogenase n=1 Tax=Heyndrickxia sporothermodurans TaxID=46224 RepID=UPI002DBFD628|nr:nucleotide sugar dehydrogenase [Heyndrickxia sporothermodurans]MEB6550243.1 nucleotide sugar dehydrogenase [Heyndrickxia sporothermodurans]
MIQDKTPKVAVIGLGFVGLPLTMLLVSKGFKVTGLDIDVKKISSINNGKSYISDISNETLVNALGSNQFSATSNTEVLEKVDIIIICVPTPLKEDKSPNLKYVQSAAEMIQKRMKKGQLIVLESSTYPGTTRDIVKPILEKSGLLVGRDFHLAYSPERVDPGNKQFELENTPKVVGGITVDCKEVAVELYTKIYSDVVPVSSTEAAEFTKLLENTYRFVNISFMNEMAIMCNEIGVNLWEVIDAASTKPYGYHPFYPGPGISGHCIPVDPLYLQFIMKQKGLSSQFIHLSDQMNKDIVDFIVRRTFEIAEKEKPSVLIYGLTYKKDISDIRDSRAIDIFAQLIEKGAQVAYHDPFIPEVEISGERKQCIALDPQSISENDIVLILTDHSAIPSDLIAKHAKAIYDTRAVYKDDSLSKGNIKQLGNGLLV